MSEKDKMLAGELYDANYDKELIINRLHQFGILTIYCEPKELSINLINKYLEIKARGIF